MIDENEMNAKQAIKTHSKKDVKDREEIWLQSQRRCYLQPPARHCAANVKEIIHRLQWERPTDRRTDTARCRVACPRLKMQKSRILDAAVVIVWGVREGVRLRAS